jgi:AcrR family transcriptional regulator
MMAAKQRGRRATLSREIILEAAFRVVDDDEMNELTMSRLGRELDADPSAVYRHFRNKDELLLAMADVMLEESYRAYVEGDAPLENLRRMVWSLRRSYLRRPGLARFVTYRFTGGEAEAASVRAMLHNMSELGYDEDRCIENVRALAEMTLGHISMTADVLALPRKAQGFELSMGQSYYTHPLERPTRSTDAELREAHLTDGEQVFHTMLEAFLAGVVAMVPAPPKRRAR